MMPFELDESSGDREVKGWPPGQPEVPVFVNYLSFSPPTTPWVPGNTATSNRVWFAIEPECCGFHG
jgi:hypothetical protein